MNQAKRHLDGEIDCFKVEFRFRCKDNSWMWIQGTGKIVERDDDGNPIRFVGTHSNITERKKAENELKLLNERLEQIVEERTKEIQRLLQQKDEFINQLGHDLKTPLGPFTQLLPILKNHVDTKKDIQIINVLERNAYYMRNLVKKTIELAKLNSKKTTFTYEPIILHDLIEDVISTNKTFFEEYDTRVHNEVPYELSVLVDSLHIRQVFTNLFNNAVKYNDGTGRIEVNAQAKDNSVIVSVKDNGIGLSHEQIHYLFDEYYKADPSRHDFDSSGLGLPICKRIVQRHGGKIWAESNGLGKGSTFYFTLPLSEQKH
jgi:signal transduction histidine kinase